jgi:YebC/PmpR family DNA-binding regulatory protein
MGAQWKNQGKAAMAQAKGAVLGKLAREISVAAKLGDPDPANNPRLRAAVEAARKQSMPRDTIERSIKKGAGLLDENLAYETVTFEGFAPHQVPVIVECLTENRNRTSSEVRVLFRKGSLGAVGSVGWMFDRMGMVEGTHKDKGIDIESIAIEAGAQNVEPLSKEDTGDSGTGAKFFTEITDLDSVAKFLSAQGWTLTATEIGYVPKNFPELNAEQQKEVAQFLNDLDDNDDVHRVYAAMK